MYLSLIGEFREYFLKNKLAMVDIGASGGAMKEWQGLGEYAQIIGFEPDQRAYNDLAGKKAPSHSVKYLNTLVSRTRNSKVKFNLYKCQQLSSMFLPNSEVLSKFGKTDAWEIDRSMDVEVDSLDNQLEKAKVYDIDFLKIDTQGSELLVLEGAENTLNRALFGVYVEIEFNPVYKEQPLFSEVDIFLRKNGFQLFEIIRSKYWKRPVKGRFVKSKGQIMYGDMLYLRDFDYFDILLRSQTDKILRKSKFLKAAVVSDLYGHMDYGFEILTAGIKEELFNKEEIVVLKRIMEKQKQFNFNLSSSLPDFKGKQRLINWLGALCRGCKKRENRWINGAIWK